MDAEVDFIARSKASDFLSLADAHEVSLVAQPSTVDQLIHEEKLIGQE